MVYMTIPPDFSRQYLLGVIQPQIDKNLPFSVSGDQFRDAFHLHWDQTTPTEFLARIPIPDYLVIYDENADRFFCSPASSIHLD